MQQLGSRRKYRSINNMISMAAQEDHSTSERLNAAFLIKAQIILKLRFDLFPALKDKQK